MLYMVEMELPDRSRVADWHDWYENHIRKLLTLEGYHASQRFEAVGARSAPFLAVHDVVGPELFEGDGYRGVGGPSGTGAWRALMTNWSRNLFSGCDALPEVAMDARLALVDDAAKLPGAVRDGFTWLTCVGLDRSVPERGFQILPAGADDAPLRDAGADLFKPITGKMR